MKPTQAAIRIPALALLVILGIVTLPAPGVAADDAQAEREARRIEGEARRQQELARRQMEDQERAQAEALRSQEQAIRRMEATRSALDANAQQNAQQVLDDARIFTLINSRPYSTPSASPQRYDPVSGMAFAPLSERLGSYFGTQSGVLVLRAGDPSPFGLQDGDVILSIDGRVPIDGLHASSILRSYRPGERVRLRVQRDRQAMDLDTTAPDQRAN